MNDPIQEAYASAPTKNYIIQALEIEFGDEVIRICKSYKKEVRLYTNGWHNFEGGAIKIQLPARNDRGQQKISFTVWNVSGFVNQKIREAREERLSIKLRYYEFMSDNRGESAINPLEMDVESITTTWMETRIDASYQDLLNQIWNRERYTSETAPAIQYE